MKIKFFIIFVAIIFAANIANAASIIGTKTEQNLLAAFTGESHARNKYDFYASAANSEGLQSVGKIFTETAAMEKEHGHRFFKFLERSDEMPVNYSANAGKIGTTVENLGESIQSENAENSKMYLEMANTARAEGFLEIAETFENIANAESYHENRFRTVLSNLENGTYFSKATPVRWKCSNCGFHTSAPGAPDKCPACDHPKGFFIEIREEYF